MTLRPKLLIADDDGVLVDAMREILEEDFSVETASDGSEAVSKASSDRPDVVVIDARMPNMDGYEACRKMRGRPEMAGVPIIMISGRTGGAAAREAFAAGASDLISKPFSISQLRTRARTWLMRGGENHQAALRAAS